MLRDRLVVGGLYREAGNRTRRTLEIVFRTSLYLKFTRGILYLLPQYVFLSKRAYRKWHARIQIPQVSIEYFLLNSLRRTICHPRATFGAKLSVHLI